MGAYAMVYFGFELINGSAATSTEILKYPMMTISVETCSATAM
jgi:hypothetical protein